MVLTSVRPLIFLKSLPWNDGLTLVQPEMGSYNEVPYTLYDPEKVGAGWFSMVRPLAIFAEATLQAYI